MTIHNTFQTQSPLQLGFIGGGLSSSIGQTHYVASQLDGRWQLTSGFFSRNNEINQKTSEKWNVPQDRLYESWKSFIKAEAKKIDAVVVLVPTPEHTEIVCSLLEEKVPVICEKPLASSLGDVNMIHNTFQQSSNFLAVTFNYSGYPMVRELKAMLDNGELGQLQKLHFEMPQEGFLRLDPITGKAVAPQGWRLNDDYIPTICLDLGVHLHHLAYFLTGLNPIRTIGDFANHSSYKGLVDDIMMWLEFEDGMKGSFWMSKTALGNRNGLKLRIYGTEGSAVWLQTNPEELMVSYRNGTMTTIDRASKTKICSKPRYNRYKAGHPSGFIEAFANLYCDIADALMAYRENGKHENPYVFGIGHSMSGIDLFTAARKSNDDRCWVETNFSSEERKA